MSDVNVMRKRAGTVLSDGVNKHFLSLLCGFLWHQFGNLIVTLCACLIQFGHSSVVTEVVQYESLSE
jgi:hypothetical protein